jgi:hypothetical protein
MTLSEYEQHTLNGIENNCRREDPAFVDRMNLTAAQQRSSRAVVMAHWAIWIGWLMLMIGGGLARGPVSIGVFVACYGLALIVTGAATWMRNRSPRTRTIEAMSTGHVPLVPGVSWSETRSRTNRASSGPEQEPGTDQ